MNFTNTVMVTKVGGSTLSAEDTSLSDVATLQAKGAHPVLVHGGGNYVSDWMARQGVKAEFIDGLRVTDANSLEIATAVLAGLVNKQLVASLTNLGAKAIGISGVDGGIVQANIESPELGFVGTSLRVDPFLIQMLIQAGYIPVISPISIQVAKAQSSRHILNVNADTVAGAVAIAMQADSLVFLTDVEGILDKDGGLFDKVTPDLANELIESNVVKGGMVPKLEACIEAAINGIDSGIVDGRRSGAILDYVSNIVSGTKIVSGPST